MINGAITLVIPFGILLEDILRDLHQVIQRLLTKLFGKTPDDLFSVFTVDGDTKRHLQNNHQSLKVHESRLVYGSDARLLDIMLHGLKLFVELLDISEHWVHALLCSLLVRITMEILIENIEAHNDRLIVFKCLVRILLIIAGLRLVEHTWVHRGKSFHDTHAIL
jgi:hypothetical protein